MCDVLFLMLYLYYSLYWLDVTPVILDQSTWYISTYPMFKTQYMMPSVSCDVAWYDMMPCDTCILLTKYHIKYDCTRTKYQTLWDYHTTLLRLLHYSLIISRPCTMLCFLFPRFSRLSHHVHVAWSKVLMIIWLTFDYGHECWIWYWWSGGFSGLATRVKTRSYKWRCIWSIAAVDFY